MKRLLLGVALATAASAIVAAPAQAAGKDPVAAVKQQFVAGKGVKFVDRTSITDGKRSAIVLRRTGTFQFGRSGVVASDQTTKFNIPAELLGEDEKFMAKPEHVIVTGRKTYLSGSFWSTVASESQPWLKFPTPLPGGLLGSNSQLVNVTEPATLKTLLKGAKHSGSVYSGSITFGKLKQVSPWARASFFTKQSAAQLKTPISFKLVVNSKGLPVRLVTTYPLSALGKVTRSEKNVKFSVASTFSGWGSKVTISAPPADQIYTGDGSSLSTDDIPLDDLGKLLGQ